MEHEQRRLYRNPHDKVLAGVCSGLGEYLDVDPVLLRVAWVALVLLGGFGILLYIIWIFLVPMKPAVPAVNDRDRRPGMAGIVVGSLMIFLGLLFLADEWYWIDIDRIWHMSWDYVGPLLLIVAGGWFLFRSQRAREEPSEPRREEGQRTSGHSFDGKRLRKSRENKKLFGVCGGVGVYTNVDPTVIRLLFVGLTLASPPVGIVSYLALAIFMPSAEADRSHVRPEAQST